MKKPVRVWTYVSRGFYAHDKKEIIFSLKCPKDDLSDDEIKNFPEDPLHLFANMFDECIDNDETLDVGECRPWDDEKGFIDAKYKGLGFGPVNMKLFKMSGIELDPDIPIIMANPLYDTEYQVCKAFGTVRVLTLLGKQNKQYPTRQYTDKDRECVIQGNFSDIKKTKAHAEAEQILISRLSAVLNPEANKVTLKCFGYMASLFKTVIDTISPDKTLLFLLSFSPDAEHHLIWDPEVKNTLLSHQVISQSKVPIKKPNELVGGSFVSFCPCKGSSKDLVTLHEDGFLLLISENTWNTVRHCLSLGLSFTIKSDHEIGLDFEVSFVDEVEND